MPVAPTVVLYPGELEWDCDCNVRVRPCEHLAAAAIALSQTEGDTSELKTADAAGGSVVYRFRSAEHGLSLERFIAAADGQERALASSLMTMLAQPGAAA